MKAQGDKKTVGELVDLYRAGMLKANPEYQRGVVWGDVQKKKLIDSVLRGYPLPLIYLHHIKKTIAGMQREDLEIIDGQQRITALYEFAEGNFKLFDPIADDEKAKFPAFIKNQACPWGGRNFEMLEPALRSQFLNTSLAVTQIDTDQENEVRDLFVRLQSGLPLNAQETRDAWPGQFTDFILWLGGKTGVARYPGHNFFHDVMGLKSASDRGKTRQFAAQIAMLYFSRKEYGADYFTDINAKSINEFYFSHVDFDRTSKDAERLVAIFDKLAWLLRPGDRPKLKAHDAIHLVLLVDTLWDDYTRSWESTLPKALDKFLENLSVAKEDSDSAQPSEYWTQYGQWTRVNSDRGERIAHRHRFYMEKMFQFLDPLTLKDPTRAFGELERTILFYRQNKRCAECDSDVMWGDAEVHHVEEYAKGGHTKLENGALVHKHCHPKGVQATKAFAEKFRRKREAAIAALA